MKHALLTTVFLLCCSLCYSQGDGRWPDIDASPMELIYYPQQVAWRNYLDGEDRTMKPKIKVVYSRPQIKGREIFGGLIAYGSEWRLGANEATSISFYQPVGIGESNLSAGTYTIAADVNQDEWTIHLSTETGIWGIANRDKDQVVASVTVPTESLPSTTEALSMALHEVDDQMVHLIIQWENTRVRLPIDFNPIQFNNIDVSPMDISHYPANSAYTNYLKGDDRSITPKVTVMYHRPSKKDRKVFGELVPYGKAWRLGANELTEIVFHQKTMIQDTEINSGRYGLYAVVNRDHWDLILSKDIPAWGIHNRDTSMDMATIRVPASQEDESVENLSIIFEEVANGSVDMVIAWDQTRATANMIFK